MRKAHRKDVIPRFVHRSRTGAGTRIEPPLREPVLALGVLRPSWRASWRGQGSGRPRTNACRPSGAPAPSTRLQVVVVACAIRMTVKTPEPGESPTHSRGRTIRSAASRWRLYLGRTRVWRIFSKQE